MSEQGESILNEEPDDGTKSAVRRRSTAKGPVSGDMSATPGCSTAEQEPINPDSNVIKINEEQRKGKMWLNYEIMVFYEAVKQLGKDFDGIVKVMQKKKVYKDKHQIRNFFFNCAKFLRNLCDINVDEMFPNVCRDAKELFFVINSCEWRKRTGASKYQVDRMKELILEGTTTIKANKKNLVLKTPICPALQKYFTEFRIAQPEKVTEPTVTLQLTPATYLDKMFVLSCEQNPVLNLKLSINDRLSRVFDFLRVKWKDSLQVGEIGQKLRLFPSKETEVGRVLLTNADPYGDIVSLNKLKREQESIKHRSNEKPSKLPQNIATNYTAVVNRPFTIDDQVILGGLTEDNVNETSLAELYCLCGLRPQIKLVYSIQSSGRTVETWKLFQELVSREYGEQLSTSTSNREEEMPAPVPQSVVPSLVKKARIGRSTAAEPAATRLREGSSVEMGDMALFKRQLKNSNVNAKFSTGKRIEGTAGRPPSVLKRSICEPTDFSHLMMVESFSTGTDGRSDGSAKLDVSSDRECDKSRLSEGTLHSESIQKYVHVTMNDVLQQDSNQVIGTMAELLNSIEDTR